MSQTRSGAAQPAPAIARAMLSAFLGLLPAAAAAQQAALPDYAYDMVTEISLATTADQKCDGISARKKRVEKRILEMYQRLVQDGYKMQEAVAALQDPATLAEVAAREKALRARHGVAPEGDQALCQAIRAEAAANESVAGLMRIR